jgi:hypothetical protein
MLGCGGISNAWCDGGSSQAGWIACIYDGKATFHVGKRCNARVTTRPKGISIHRVRISGIKMQMRTVRLITRRRGNVTCLPTRNLLPQSTTRRTSYVHFEFHCECLCIRRLFGGLETQPDIIWSLGFELDGTFQTGVFCRQSNVILYHAIMARIAAARMLTNFRSLRSTYFTSTVC